MDTSKKMLVLLAIVVDLAALQEQRSCLEMGVAHRKPSCSSGRSSTGWTLRSVRPALKETCPTLYKMLRFKSLADLVRFRRAWSNLVQTHCVSAERDDMTTRMLRHVKAIRLELDKEHVRSDSRPARHRARLRP